MSTTVGAERWRILTAYVDALQDAAGTSVVVTRRAPTDKDDRPRLIAIVKMDGDIEVPAFGGRLLRDDRWEVRLMVRVMGLGHDEDFVIDQHNDLLAVVDNLAADDHGLDGDSGLVSHEVTRVEDHALIDAGPDGLVAVATVVVQFHTRLT